MTFAWQQQCFVGRARHLGCTCFLQVGIPPPPKKNVSRIFVGVLCPQNGKAGHFQTAMCCCENRKTLCFRQNLQKAAGSFLQAVTQLRGNSHVRFKSYILAWSRLVLPQEPFFCALTMRLFSFFICHKDTRSSCAIFSSDRVFFTTTIFCVFFFLMGLSWTVTVFFSPQQSFVCVFFSYGTVLETAKETRSYRSHGFGNHFTKRGTCKRPTGFFCRQFLQFPGVWPRPLQNTVCTYSRAGWSIASSLAWSRAPRNLCTSSIQKRKCLWI